MNVRQLWRRLKARDLPRDTRAAIWRAIAREHRARSSRSLAQLLVDSGAVS